MNLICSNTQSCQSASIYCPYREENSCSITCSESTQTCYEMQIYVPDGYEWNYLDLTCASQEIFGSDSCTNLNINCNDEGRLDTTYSYFSDPINAWKCTNNDPTYCCPYYNTSDEIGGCSAGEDCIVDCTNTACGSKIIDASEASSLTVNCNGTILCQNTVIYCPPNGCDIVCADVSACRYSTIVYNGKLADYGAINLTCYGYYTCYDMIINAEYINELEWSCTSRGLSGYGDNTCHAVLNANYANKVIINTNNDYASYYDTWNVMYANEVIINGRWNNIAYRRLTLRADFAGSVTLYWSGRFYYYPGPSDLYIPQNTKIYCYGYGCKYLYNLRRGSINTAEGLEIIVDSCEQCTILSACLSEFDLFCDNGSDEYSEPDYCSWSFSPLYNYECGCEELINNVSYITDYTEQRCYSPRTVRTCAQGVPCVIDCDADEGNCVEDVIDGRLATSLSLNCTGISMCQDAVIWCPSGDCYVSCDGQVACNRVKIMYQDVLADNASLRIDCRGYRPCYDIEVDADYINELELNCYGEVGEDSYNYVCIYNTINANYANKVSINGFELKAIYDSKFYVMYAGSVIITASGDCM